MLISSLFFPSAQTSFCYIPCNFVAKSIPSIQCSSNANTSGTWQSRCTTRKQPLMLHRTIYIAEWISVQFRKFSRKFSREKHFGREIFPCCVFLHINARTIYIYETCIRETIATMFTNKEHELLFVHFTKNSLVFLHFVQIRKIYRQSKIYTNVQNLYKKNYETLGSFWQLSVKVSL